MTDHTRANELAEGAIGTDGLHEDVVLLAEGYVDLREQLAAVMADNRKLTAELQMWQRVSIALTPSAEAVPGSPALLELLELKAERYLLVTALRDAHTMVSSALTRTPTPEEAEAFAIARRTWEPLLRLTDEDTTDADSEEDQD